MRKQKVTIGNQELIVVTPGNLPALPPPVDWCQTDRPILRGMPQHVFGFIRRCLSA